MGEENIKGKVQKVWHLLTDWRLLKFLCQSLGKICATIQEKNEVIWTAYP